MIPLSEYIAALKRNAAELPAKKLALVKAHMEVGAEAAKAMIGKEHPNIWPALSPVTVADKRAHGYDVPAPLLRDGTLRESYAGAAEEVGTSIVGTVYSTDEKSEWLELGTIESPHPIPPRPVSYPALLQTEPARLEELAKLASETLTIRR